MPLTAGSENPSAAFLAGQQHGQALATQHHAATKTVAAAPVKAAPVKAAPSKVAGTAGDTLLAQAQALAQQQTKAVVDAILAQQKVYTGQGQQQSTDINNAAQAAAQLLQNWNLPGTTSSSYTDAANAIGSLAKGFSGQTQTDATNAANQVQQNLAGLGAPGASLKTATGQTIDPSATANVLYGLGGFIPGNLLETSGQAAAAQQRTLPLNLLAGAQSQAAGAVQAGNDRAATLEPQVVDAQGKLPSLTQSIYGSLVSAKNTAFDQALKTANFNLATQKVKDAESNTAFNQKVSVAKLNQAATRLANTQFNADRNYQTKLANLGISQTRVQQTITANAFKAAHGGYTQKELTKFQTQANGLANSYFHGSSVTRTVNGVPKTTGVSGLPYNAALSQLMKKGVPVQVALKALDRVYPANLRPSPQALQQLLGPLTPEAVAAQSQTDANTPAVAGLAETSPTTILTQSAPQTRAIKAYAFTHAANKYGWADNANLAALDKLWTQESGWNPNAVNKSSGAAGIPQALGHGHVYNLGDYRSQVDWGLKYILGRYGSPAAAWQHEVQFNWY